jgi:hypothetical protein
MTAQPCHTRERHPTAPAEKLELSKRRRIMPLPIQPLFFSPYYIHTNMYHHYQIQTSRTKL